MFCGATFRAPVLKERLQIERTAQTGSVCIFITDRIASSPAEFRGCVKVEVAVLGSCP